MKPKTHEEMAKPVHVTAQLTAKWDGKEYDLRKGANVATGTVEHWQSVFPTVKFNIEEIPQTPIVAREIENPLEEHNRGTAFAGLKKGRKPQGG